MVSQETLTSTRESLHAVAELVLAGAQYGACQRITLRSSPGGFATRYTPDLRVQGVELVGDFGRVRLHGATVRELCTAAGVDLTDLSTVYSDGATLGPDEVLTVDPDAAALLESGWSTGAQALARVAPDAEPILWPEHFDLGITVDEVNLGVSPGDRYLGVPYAYVGPWAVPGDDTFFDAPFGSARPVSGFAAVSELVAYFTEGLSRAAAARNKAAENL